MIPTKFTKQPWEERNLQFDFSDALLTGDLINDTTGTAVYDSSATPVDKSSTMLGTVSIDATRTKVIVNVKGGTDGAYYWVRVRVSTVGGDKIEDDLKLVVKQLGA
jgi:hypothetical protein